jgi:hypothetical protein
MADTIVRTSKAENGNAKDEMISCTVTGCEEDDDDDDDDESLSTPTPTKGVDPRSGLLFSNSKKDSTPTSTTTTTTRRKPQHDDDNDNVETKKKKKKKTTTGFLLFLAGFLRLLILELPLLVVLFLYLCVKTMVNMHDTHFGPLFRAALFYDRSRNATELTYYYRECDLEDLTTTTRDDLIVDPHLPLNAGATKLTEHGVAMFPNVLSNETASTLRDFILQQNELRTSWEIIEGEHRSMWGIDINMHPAFHQAWKEVARNKHLMGALTDLVGPDPGTCLPAHPFSDQNGILRKQLVIRLSTICLPLSFFPFLSLFLVSFPLLLSAGWRIGWWVGSV